jgi:NDP-sugar pyrophosphorylase family protein
MLAAILLLETDIQVGGLGRSSPEQRISPQKTLDGVPLACLEVLGQSTIQRTVGDLQRAGVSRIVLLAEAELAELAAAQLDDTIEVQPVLSAEMWDHANQQAHVFADSGATNILMTRLGAYAEVDITELLEYHQQPGRSITRVHDRKGPLDIWMISAEKIKSNSVTVAGLEREPFGGTWFTRGYTNRLARIQDVRRLAVDAFLSRTAFKPNGVETKPGIWVGEGAQIHRHARLVAPAYVGKGTVLAAATLITRFSNVECDCEVGYGTVVEDASILANTYVGTGLDVTQSVVRGDTLAHLKRNIVMQVEDGALIGRSLPFNSFTCMVRHIAKGRFFRTTPRLTATLQFRQESVVSQSNWRTL